MSPIDQAYISKFLKDRLLKKRKKSNPIAPRGRSLNIEGDEEGGDPFPPELLCYLANMPQRSLCVCESDIQITTTPSILKLFSAGIDFCQDYDESTGYYKPINLGLYLINFKFVTEPLKLTEGLTFKADFYKKNESESEDEATLEMTYSDIARSNTTSAQPLQLSGNFRMVGSSDVRFFVKLSVSSGTAKLAQYLHNTFMEIMPLMYR